MEMTPRTPEFDRLAFTVLAIEASAQKMNISPSEMRRRLDKVGLKKVSYRTVMTLCIRKAVTQ